MPELGEFYRGRVVVVTGGYGYLGTGLSALLRKAGARLRRSTRGRNGVTGDDEAWVGDLGDADFVARLVEGAGVVFHMAGQTSIKESHDDPLGDLRANVGSTLTLLQACAMTGRCPRFVYAGTATELGMTEAVPIAPETPDRPITVYDANKLAAEQLVGVYREMGAVHGTTLRIANVYGPGAAKSAPDRGVTNKIVTRALQGHPLTYFGDGALLRDYVFIDDLLEAFRRTGALADRATERSYVVAGGRGYTLKEAFNLVADVVASLGYPRVPVGSAPWPETTHRIDRRSFLADIAPLRTFADWTPTVSLEQGLRATAASILRAT